MTHRSIRRKAVWGACWLVLFATSAASAQAPTAPPPAPPEEGVFDPAQPDFTVITMPTTLRLPRHKSAFRLTHRFGRPLGQGDFGDLVSDLFGLDSGAQIGLEFRVAPMRGVQAGLYRTNDKTLEFFGQLALLREATGRTVAVDGVVSVEGTNNFRDEYSPALGAVVSRRFGTRGGVYAMPLWVHNTNLSPAAADRRLRPGHPLWIVRHREARRRARFSTELLERARHHAGASGPRRISTRGLVHRLQPDAQVLLNRWHLEAYRQGPPRDGVGPQEANAR